MSERCCGCDDTTKGRAKLWAEHTRACESCARRLWTDKDGMFTLDPRGLRCDVCVMKPYHLERNRQARAEAGRRGHYGSEKAQANAQRLREAAEAGETITKPTERLYKCTVADFMADLLEENAKKARKRRRAPAVTEPAPWEDDLEGLEDDLEEDFECPWD